MTDTIEKLLRDVPLFQRLDASELDRVVQIAIPRHYRKRMVIFMEGDERESVYFIRAGMVKAYKIDEEGREQIVSLLHAGDMFPHVGFFDPSPYPATAEVIEDCELLAIRIKDFEQLLVSYPSIAMKVMQILGQKILQLQARIQELTLQDVHLRTVHTLIRLGQEYGVKQEDGSILLSLPFTHQDLANMIGTSRETVNRTLNGLRRDKILEINKRDIIIRNLDELKAAF